VHFDMPRPVSACSKAFISLPSIIPPRKSANRTSKYHAESRSITSSNPPCPTCCTSRVVPAVLISICSHCLAPMLPLPQSSFALLSIFPPASPLSSASPLPSQKIDVRLTLGKFTPGMITSFSALGASFFPLLLSPPGWYWYLASLPVFQGSEPGAMETLFSEEEEVGLREKCQPARPKAPDIIARRVCIIYSQWGWLGEGVGVVGGWGRDGGQRGWTRGIKWEV